MTSLTMLGLTKTRFTSLIMVALLIMGTIAYSDFPKREDPEITIRSAYVTARFPGLSPERMEKLIAEQMERKIRSIEAVEDIDTLINTGRLKIQVKLEDSVTDLNPVWQTLRDKMDEIKPDLPEGTFGPFVNTEVGDVTIASIAMTAEGFSYRDMEVAAKDLQRELYTIAGVGKVVLYGVQEERIWLEVDVERIAAIGGQLQTLISDLQSQNVILPAGNLDADGTNMLLEASGDFKTVAEVERMLTKVSQSDEFLRLQDFVTVKRGYVSPADEPVFFNGRPALSIGVQMEGGIDIEDLGLVLRQKVRDFETRLPIGFALEFATFQPDVVADSVADAVSNVGQTFLVVVAVVLVFLGWRSGLVISSIVPFAVLFALLGMGRLGIALEQVSIAAVIISLGLLVDNGVVIVEDILRRINNGATRRDAAKASGSQFSGPLLISSLTTIFAFTPFFLMDGSKGEYAFSLGSVVALTLIGSWISAIYFMPLIATKMLKRQTGDTGHSRTGPDSGTQNTTDGGAETLPGYAQRYQTVLAALLPRSPLVVFGLLALVVLSLSQFQTLPAEQFPESERTEILIYMDMPKVTHISQTTATSLDISRWLNDKSVNPDLERHITYVGAGGPRFYLALTPAEKIPSSAFFLINAKTPAAASAFSDRARRYFVENHPEAIFKVKRLAMGADESGLVDVEISGPELDRLLNLGRAVGDIFRDIPGLIQNENNWGEKVIKFEINIDQDKARRLGITSENLSQRLNNYFNGSEISVYREDDQSIPIIMRAAEKDRDSVEDLLNITLGGNQDAIALEQVSNLQPRLEYSQIRRKNQVRTLIVTAKSTEMTAGALYEAVRSDIDALDLSGGYTIAIGGELEEAAETNGELAAGMPYALVLMLLAVVYQFNSIRRAAVIFFTIPLIFVGIPYGLMLTAQPMSFFAQLGIISLAGIVINNAIVLVDQIDIEIKSHPVDDAITLASAKRLRPILLTSITTVLGLLPLYLFGGVLWTPLAVVMIFGLSIASVLTLFYVPALYHLLMRERTAGA